MSAETSRRSLVTWPPLSGNSRDSGVGIRDSGFPPSLFELRRASVICMISELDRKQLLSLARQALEARVAGDRPPDVACTGPLALRCGAFVSIHSGEHLRGCLGRLTVDS